MNKSAKFLSAFLIAMIVLSIGGFFASYRKGKNQPAQTTTSSATSDLEQTETTGKTTPSSQTNTENETRQTVISTTIKSENKTKSTSAATTVKTGYPFNYAGVNPVQAKITAENWNMMLINADNYLPDSYNFKLATAVEGYPAKLDARVAVFYKQMFDAAKKDGLTLNPTSINGGHRTTATQQRLFEEKIARYGTKSDATAVKKAALINQPPACSEHNAGLAMDISSTTNFETTKEYKWLSKNAADYGFIMRYPASKSAITGVMYEPWHWRFVGLEHAPKIKASGLCLEEYLETL